MKKFEPKTYTMDIQQVGDHLEVHISPLDITVSTAPGKLAYTDAMDAAYTFIEKSLMAEEEATRSARSPRVRSSSNSPG